MVGFWWDCEGGSVKSVDLLGEFGVLIKIDQGSEVITLEM